MTPPLPGTLSDGVHLLSGLALALSFVLLYQRRPRAMVRAYAAQALAAALVAVWHGWYGSSLPALLGGALLAAGAAAMQAMMRVGLGRRAAARHGADARAEQGGIATLAIGVAVVAAAVAAVQGTPLPPADAAAPTREDLAFALSVLLLGLLAAASRPAPLAQAVGLLSMWNGLVLAAAGGGSLALLAAGSAGLLAPAAAVLLSLRPEDGAAVAVQPQVPGPADGGPVGHAADRAPS